MSDRLPHPLSRLLPLLAACAGAFGALGADDAAALEFFESRVRPILVDHCYSCHGTQAKKIRGDFVLDSMAGWQKGGASGKPAIVPGKPDESPLIRAVRYADADTAMPPRKGGKDQKLTDEAVAVLEAWVTMGAPDPRTGGTVLADPSSLAKEHWAFQPVREPALPSVKDPAWPQTAVDRFILADLEAAGFPPNPPADRRTLIRRASYLLTGFSPSPVAVAAFEADPSPDAFDRVVDDLLASPGYGERWARHWLDTARYADTKGYVFEEERRYPYAYTYRDWVIRALNEDRPYDEFLRAQIAADLVPDGAVSDLAALGFMTLGRRFLNNQHDIIDDRIDTLTRGTMALTVACARCHDHKYDPIPAADYYSLYGVFASSSEPAEKPLLGPNADPRLAGEFDAERAKRDREVKDFQAATIAKVAAEVRGKVGDYLLAWHDSQGLDGEARVALLRTRQLPPHLANKWLGPIEAWQKASNALFAPFLAFHSLGTNDFTARAAALAADVAAQRLPGLAANGRVATAFATNPPATMADVAAAYTSLFKAADAAEPQAGPATEELRRFLYAEGSPAVVNWDEAYQAAPTPDQQRYRALKRKLDETEATHPGAPLRAMALADNATPSEPVVFKRGNPGNRGESVRRQFLEVIAGPERKPFEKGSGRLELAEAVASPDNPLTARVIVNRVWQQHFGAGLVRTPADFGLRSEPPTHPELLDHLAGWFVREGWSLKKLHRLLLSSAVWQQSSASRPEALERDPENRLLWRMPPHRRDFEGLRDSLLAASGSLDQRMGGQPVEIAAARDYAVRRSVYGFVERQNLPGLFRTFDFATPDVTSAQRFQTTVPQQALFLLNSPFMLDRARAAAWEIRSAEPSEVIDQLYARLFQRDPTPAERELGRAFLAAAEDSPANPSSPVWQYGYGAFDEAAGRLVSFTPLPHFQENQWRGGPAMPDPKVGWLLLNARGGHPGSRAHGAVVRRWTAPREGAFEITGRLKHDSENGDGIRATVLARDGTVLGQWTAKKEGKATKVEQVTVRRGDSVDFVVDCRADENSDGFEWAPKVRMLDPAASSSTSASIIWEAARDFAGPQPMARPLNRLERYAQVVLMSNEFAFVD
ncbi:MAG: PSD1 and planctomycete cytochrome C domain-containing protein [Limisphaerales bacterium]